VNSAVAGREHPVLSAFRERVNLIGASCSTLSEEKAGATVIGDLRRVARITHFGGSNNPEPLRVRLGSAGRS